MTPRAGSAALLVAALTLAVVAAARDGAHPNGEDPRAGTPRADATVSPAGEQPEAARRRELAVNLFLCANALPGCDSTLLTPEQRERFLENRPPSQ